MDYKYNGIIISKRDVAEVDRIYHVYTREVGKIRVLGKGVRKPDAKLAGQLEPVTTAEIFVARSRGMGKITGAIVSHNFLQLKSDLTALIQVFYIFGIFERMVAQQEKDERIFDLLYQYLEHVDKASETQAGKDKIEIMTLGFLFKFLDFLGYKIDAEKCMDCGNRLKDEVNFFSAELGGFICANSKKRISKSIKSTSGAIKLIRLFSRNEIKNFSKIKAPAEDIKNAKIIVAEMIRWIVG